MFKEGIAKFLKLDSLMENLTGYVETRLEILKYELKDDISRLTGSLSVFIGLLLLGMFFLMLASIALAILLGENLGYAAGFGLISAVYLVAGVIVFLNRDTLAHRVEKKVKELIKQKQK